MPDADSQLELDKSILLVDFDRVKKFIGWKSTSTVLDEPLIEAINSVCSLIHDWTDRQLVKELAPDTRRFVLDRDDVDERSCMIDDLADLDSIDLVQRDGTLVAAIDLDLVEEIKARRWREGWPIEELEFIGGYPNSAPLLHGLALDITGTWGWPAVPSQATYWAMQTIADWAIVDLAKFAASIRLDTQRVQIPDVLPAAAKKGLQSIRRIPV